MKTQLRDKEIIIAVILAVLITVLFWNQYSKHKESHSIKVNVVPVVKSKAYITKPKDFYDDSCITEEKKFYYEHLYNTTEE